MPFRRWFSAATISAALAIVGSISPVGLAQLRPPVPSEVEDEQAREGDQTDRPHRRRGPHDRGALEGRRRGLEGRRRGGPPDRVLTAEEIEQLLSIMERIHPRFAERLRQAGTERARHMLRRHWRLLGLLRLKEHDPDGFELRVQDMSLERQSRELARQIRDEGSSKDSDRGKLARKELRELVSQHFEVRQKIKEHELAKLERRIDELRKAIGQRTEKKGQIIEEQHKQLLDESDRSAW